MSGQQKIFVTRELPENGMKALRKLGQVECNPEDRPLTAAEIGKGAAQCEALVCLLSEKIDEAILAQAPNLRIIANYAAGYNNIDVPACVKRGIFVTNTPGALTDATADLTWALLLAAARHIPAGDRMMRADKFDGWAPKLMRGQSIPGKTLGIVGLGQIGSAVAQRAAGFKMEILYVSRSEKPQAEQAFGAKRVQLDELLRRSDFVSLHCPLTPETRHLIGAREFSLMKKNAILLNMARGPVVDEKALVEALKNQTIFAAGLDVFEDEPRMAPGLAELDNVVLVPHLGSATFESRDQMALMVADNIAATFQNKVPPNCVNPDAVHFRK